jgi:hypothetical protein
MRLSERMWLRLLDAGYLRTVLAGGEAFGRAIQQAPTSPARRRAEAVAAWWATRAADGARRLGAA